jgi:hypothetical protein
MVHGQYYIYSVPEKEPETKLGSAVSVNLG